MFSRRSYSITKSRTCKQQFSHHQHVSIQRTPVVYLTQQRSPLCFPKSIDTRLVSSWSRTESDINSIWLVDDNEDQFPASKGLWPKGESHTENIAPSDRYTSAETCSRSKEQCPSAKQDEFVTNTPTNTPTRSILLPRQRTKKVDLSSVNLKKWEASQNAGFFKPSIPEVRSNEGLRRILDLYNQHLCTVTEHDSEFENALTLVFSPENLQTLQKSNYDVENLISWSWILNAENVRLAIDRYLVLLEDAKEDGGGQIPFFIPLQILRAEVIDPMSFKDLLRAMQRSFSVASTGTLSAEDSFHTDHTSAVLVIVRLIRHAREVAPGVLDDIVDLVPTLLPRSSARTVSSQQRLSHIYNRFLSLLALPTSVRPFRNLPKQQQAQLNLVRQMLDFKPPIPINREGYRALIKVQLVHEKTTGERDWAAAKRLSWPPWREDRLGISEGVDYPGKQSRAMKVLKRMTEAGYQHTSWEKTATILAGWDTDKSPTIQTRSLLRQKAMTWLAGFMPSLDDKATEDDAKVWASRIVATRTVREAWSCFLSFQKEVEPRIPKADLYHVYYAMFQKLNVRSRTFPNDNGFVAGDGRETIGESSSQRHLIFVKTEPPKMEDFYDLMIAAGVSPAGRLLSDLMDRAQSVQQGIQFLNDSSYGEVRKDVLMHAEKYPERFIQDTIASIPDHFFASFIKLLCRCNESTGSLFTSPTSLAEGSAEAHKSPRYVSSLTYGSRLLFISKSHYLPAWNGLLEALSIQLRYSNIHRGRIWKKVQQTLNHMHSLQVDPDFSTFKKLSSVIETYVMPPSLFWPPTNDFLAMIKEIFSKIVSGNRSKPWLTASYSHKLEVVPDPEDILALVRVLGLAQDLTGLQELVTWLNHHAEEIKTMYQERRSGKQAMHRTLMVLRVYLEGSWSDTGSETICERLSEALTEQARIQCEPFSWPSDAELKAFEGENEIWISRIRTAISSRARREIQKVSNLKEEDSMQDNTEGQQI